MIPRQRQPRVSGASSAVVLDADPEGLTVLLDSFDGDQQHSRAAWPVEAWQPRLDATPAAGDRCLAVRDQQGRVWVVVGDWTGPAPEEVP